MQFILNKEEDAENFQKWPKKYIQKYAIVEGFKEELEDYFYEVWPKPLVMLCSFKKHVNIEGTGYQDLLDYEAEHYPNDKGN